MTRFHVVASIAALLLLAGCVSTDEYNKVVEERDKAISETKVVTQLNDDLSGELKVKNQKLNDDEKLLGGAKSEKDALNGKIKDMTDQLSLARNDAGKAKQDLVAAQNEAKEMTGKAKQLENQVGELKAQLAKVGGDADRAKDELKATIEKLTVELNDAKAQIEKLEEAAKELKDEGKAESKIDEKITEPKAPEANNGGQAKPSPKDSKVKDNKASKVQKP